MNIVIYVHHMEVDALFDPIKHKVFDILILVFVDNIIIVTTHKPNKNS